ncbi:hypothetical protein [Nostoc sp.]|uniref:hypothetical protein n=1 Tax=Nostoc sp. TaxID=1180 RepID=UPI002FF833AE
MNLTSSFVAKVDILSKSQLKAKSSGDCRLKSINEISGEIQLIMRCPKSLVGKIYVVKDLPYHYVEASYA